jgi:hypothetical protein
MPLLFSPVYSPTCLLQLQFRVHVRKCPSPIVWWSMPLVTSLSLSKHTGGNDATPTFSGRLVYFQFRWGGPLLPPVEFSTWQPLLKAFPLQGCWAGAAIPVLSGQLVCLQVAWRRVPPPLSGAQGALPSLLCVFFFPAACLLFSLFFLFSLGRGQSVQGALLICSREYCMPLICSLGGLHLPSREGAGIWWHGSPPGFSV